MEQTVLVYASTRQRKRLQRQGLKVIAEYADFVLATVSPEQVLELRSQGFEVEIQKEPQSVDLRGRKLAVAPAEGVPETPSQQPEGEVEWLAAGPPPEVLGPGRHYYLVQFVGPLKPEWLAEVEANGGILCDPVPPYAYIVTLDEEAYQWLVAKADYVRWITHYGPSLRIAPELADALNKDPRLARGRVRGAEAAETRFPPGVERVPNAFTLRFFVTEDVEPAVKRIRELGGTPGSYEAGATAITVSFEPGAAEVPARVQQLAQLHGVKSVEALTLRQLYDDVAARLTGVTSVHEWRDPPLRGRGEVIGIADSGLDTGDLATLGRDFIGNVKAIHSWPVAPAWDILVHNDGGDDGPADVRSGHGTHVAGLLVGRGSCRVAGMVIGGQAPEAKIVFQAVEQWLEWTEAYLAQYEARYGRLPPAYGLAGLPADLGLLFAQAYDSGARLHNNSWGGGEFGAYDAYAEAVDRFMWEHDDMLILFAAGNDGYDGDRDGQVDLGSVTPPGTAKNCLTVGAAESERNDGGYQEDYGTLWPSDFPAVPLREDLPSDSALDVAAFSSRGPTTDGRIKPDLVAPGTNIVSVRSQALLNGATGWGLYAPAPERYMFDGGTSMATPLVTGAAALVREYLRKVRRRRRPTAALVKAMLLHGAVYTPDRRAADAPERLYDFAQGWGHLNVARALVPEKGTALKIWESRQGIETGHSRHLSCTVTNGAVPLAVTLVWTDYPGAAGHYPNLVNDLDLVLIGPHGEHHYGNCQHVAPDADCRADRLNNVERVVIAGPAEGRYRIRVRGVNVPRGPQGFALVCSGGIR